VRLRNAVSDVVAVTLEWQGLLVNPRAIRNRDEITWNNRLPSENYAGTFEEIARLNQLRQYSLQVGSDGSLIQLYYRFHRNGSDLMAASLSFLKVPEDSESHGPWMRLDYDENADFGPTHSVSHLHLSMHGNARIPVAGVPGPRQFVEMVMAWFYPESYGRHRLNELGGWRDEVAVERVVSERISCELAKSIEEIVHIALPKAAAA